MNNMKKIIFAVSLFALSLFLVVMVKAEIVTENKIEYAKITVPEEVNPAREEKLTKKDIKQRIDNNQAILDQINLRIEQLQIKRDEVKAELDNDKLILTQFKK